MNIKTKLAKDGKRHDKPSQFHITPFGRKTSITNKTFAISSQSQFYPKNHSRHNDQKHCSPPGPGELAPEPNLTRVRSA